MMRDHKPISIADQVFEQLERLDANTCMLFTHHPKPQRLNTADPPPQIPQKWLDFLKERRISLFTYHIPLDRNSPFSPGVNLARALGAEPYDSFFEQNLVRMGVVCTSPFSTATELAQAMERVREIAAMGTGCVEIKSGYGLSTGDELKMLRVIRRIRESVPLEVRATFLGAHAVARAYRGRQGEYVDLVCNEMLPAVAAEGLADFVDVFCDEGFFTVEETARILEAARKLGLRAKIHANELAVSGGVQVGVACDALSVDHLERMGREEIEALRGAATMPTLLPGAAFFLGMSYPPARAMIDAGLGVALASDYNPGSSPSGNMRMVCSLASIRMKMTPAEAINAATLNGAYAMGLSRDYGSVTLGKVANFFITKPMPSVEFFSYAYQTPLIRQVFLRGRKMCGL